jgi:Fe-S-cluster-containing hydrogenase component 2
METSSVATQRHVIQYPIEYAMCSGCQACEIVCALTHDGANSPQYNRVFFQQGPLKTMIHTVLSCQHCEEHPCYEACPNKDEAMCLDENGIAYIVEEFCVGCGLCRRDCAFDPPRINLVKSKDRSKRKAKKCDLCRAREEGPACVQWCVSRCLGMSDVPMPEIVKVEGVGSYQFAADYIAKKEQEKALTEGEVV